MGSQSAGNITPVMQDGLVVRDARGKQDRGDVIFFLSENVGDERQGELKVPCNKNTFSPRRICEEFCVCGFFLFYFIWRPKQFCFN